MHKLRYSLLCAGALCLCLLPGCKGDEPNSSQQGNPSTDITQNTPTLGDTFMDSNLKIKSTITDFGTSPSRVITVELYVDKEGDGSGLLGFGDTLCDVVVSNNYLYVVVDTNNIVQVSNLTGRLVPSSLQLHGQDDLVSVGFTAKDGTPISYDGKEGNLVINTVFGTSTNTFDTQSVAASNTFSLAETVDYIIEYNAERQAEVETGEDDTKEVVDFYNDSYYGVSIEGTVYSLGDTCNPSTYFRGATPEGLVNSIEYKEDTKVEFTHVSYLSPDGRTVFTITDNYVQAIQTTADFEFLGIKRGDDFKELKTRLGYSLTKKQLETWKPIDESIVLKESKSKLYSFSIGEYNVELRSADNNTLTEIYIEQKLDFKGAVAN